jgi:hypothetical protein
MCMYLRCSTINLCFEAWRKCSGKVWSVILFTYVMVTSRTTKKKCSAHARDFVRRPVRHRPLVPRFVNLARHRSATYSRDEPHAVLYTPLHQTRVLAPLLALILDLALILARHRALPHIVGTNHMPSSTLLYIKCACWRLFWRSSLVWRSSLI